MGHTSGDDNIRFGAVIKAVDALGNTKLSGRAKKKTKKEMQKQFNNYFFSRLISYSQVKPQLGEVRIAKPVYRNGGYVVVILYKNKRMWRKCVSLLNNLLSKTLSILPKTKEQVLLGEQEPNISSWGKYLSYKQSRKRSTLVSHTTVIHPYSNIVKCRLLPQGLYIFISGLGGLINGKAYIQGRRIEGGLKTRTKKALRNKK